ncbi:hypothetical protein LXA43DRAFT_1090075 [Ganoderma leucocontextum]|nr:hypothetical protein LXA43DRAFT_1090075 [Ganoderma leucocontextum]
MGSSNKADTLTAAALDVVMVDSQGPSGVEDPRALMRKPVHTRTEDNKYPSLTSAMSLAEELGIQLMLERICILEDLV